MTRYQIQGITDRNGRDKEDEASKRRLGSTYQLLQILSNHPMVLEYITDNQGNPKSGYLQTSTVVDCEYIKSDELYIVTKLNSIYYVKKIGE
jgi:hypothetical protein